MPQESINERKDVPESSRWQSFHFSGKVIMCSVLFGLGLVLVGGLVMAIGIDNDSKPDNLNEIQNRAPMVVVGPVLMGIGAVTVITGIIMCLFEMNICRKREPDSKPLIDDGSISPKNREKHRNHKKSKKHKIISQGKVENLSSMPINVSQDFAHSNIFVTPSSSFNPTETLKSIINSDKSSTEFHTPSSSLQSSFEANENEIHSGKNDSKEFQIYQYKYLTPQSSTIDSRNEEDKTDVNGFHSQNDDKKNMCYIENDSYSN